jgi:ribosomal-protein-alanine N-acetyltransferase
MSQFRRETVTIPNTRQRTPYRLVPVDGTMVGRIVSLDRLNHAPDPITEVELRQQLENLGASYIAAVSEDGELLGYAGLQVVMDEGYLVNLTVKERYRRQGLGRELVNVFLRFGQVNLSFLTLTCRVSHTGTQCFFRKLGFESVGQRNDFYDEPAEDGVLMTMKFGKGTDK